MPTIVIPFAGVEGKTRLGLPAATRRALSLAMLGDVLEAALPVGEVRVVTPDAEAGSLAAAAGADAVDDPGGGQGAAVLAALDGLGAGRVLVVNADLPCASSATLRALLEATPAEGVALVAAADGTTNALGLSSAAVFAPLYGPGSAARFRAHAAASGLAAVSLELPELAADADTVGDLRRLGDGCGRRTRACLAGLLAGTAA